MKYTLTLNQLKRAIQSRDSLLHSNNNGSRTPLTKGSSVTVYIGHSFDGEVSRGAYAFRVIGCPFVSNPRVMIARSDRQIQLQAIKWILQQPSIRGALEIHTRDRALMEQLSGEEFRRLKRNGWIGADGRPLMNADLLKSIAALMDRRVVSFRSNSSLQFQYHAQLDAQRALKEWRMEHFGV